MFRRNQAPTNQADYTHYPLDYILKKNPDYYYEHRSTSGYIEKVDFSTQKKWGSFGDLRRDYHIVVGEKTHHNALAHVHNGKKPYSSYIEIDTLDPPTRAPIEGWTDQGGDGLVYTFGHTEAPGDCPRNRVGLIVDNLRLSVMALGLTMAKLDLAQSSTGSRPVQGHMTLPANTDNINEHWFNKKPVRRSITGKLMISVIFEAPVEAAAKLIS